MEEREARMVWSAIAEPCDPVAVAVVAAMGYPESLGWLEAAVASPAVAAGALRVSAAQRRELVQAIERWGARLAQVDATRMGETTGAIGARVVIPGDGGWPKALDSAGMVAPHALWVRGVGAPHELWARSIAIVGARAATSYGEHVAREIAVAAAERGYTVVSGGAHGIDAAAHAAALAAGGQTIAVLAGGVDRLYPPGNTDLLQRVLAQGTVVSEQPPGFAPHRHRFLSRNRLIAAARATIVVEAAMRSGALNTARHATGMARPVGAVPGPVTSASAAGCHALIREGGAVLVSTPEEALELAAPVGEIDQPTLSLDGREDFRSDAERRAFDALSSRGKASESVALAAGLTVREALSALGSLEMRGLARRQGARWSHVPPAHDKSRQTLT